MVNPLSRLRQYPRGFGTSLRSAWESVWGQPRFDLRQKKNIDPKKTDLQVFRSLDNTDPWVDAKLPQMFLYLYENKKLTIPSEWQPAMEQFRSEMMNYVARLD